MTDNHYGTVATLKWILSHYFYGGEHYAWLSAEYYPYRRPNPPSSDPHAIYETLYKVWKDRDDFNNYVDGVRESLRRESWRRRKIDRSLRLFLPASKTSVTRSILSFCIRSCTAWM